ncbi:MAG: serine aminopeptidase domain-containing protein [Chroococcales cyanobacterium]
MTDSENLIIFAQHGWADTHKPIQILAKAVAPENSKIIVPNLGYAKTWWRIDPLIDNVEKVAKKTLGEYPSVPVRIIGHSMGGLIWLEVLSRNPDWWPLIESLVLVASPVGGAHLARIIDPFEFGLGIAKDLGTNRRDIAREIVQSIPTLVIAGDIGGGTDGTVPVEATKVPNAKFIKLKGLSHPVLKKHPTVAKEILHFWSEPSVEEHFEEVDLTASIIQSFQSIPGMTDAHYRNFHHGKVLFEFNSGITILTWKNLFNVHHVFVSDSEGKCLYSGFVGWSHTKELHQTLEEIQEEFASELV